MKQMEVGVRREKLGYFIYLDQAEEFFRDTHSWSSRIDTSPPTYHITRFILDDLGQSIDLSEDVSIFAANSSERWIDPFEGLSDTELDAAEYILEYRPTRFNYGRISQRPPQPIIAIRPEIATLTQSKPDLVTFKHLGLYFLGEAEAIIVAECLAKWSHDESIFTELLKLLFRAPRWPVIALNLLPEETLLKNVEAEGCSLNDCAFSALYGESELFPVLYQCPPDFPEGLMPINQPIPNVELGRKLGWIYLGIAPLIATEDFSRIWFDIWGRAKDPDDRAQLPVNFWREGADYD